MSHVKDRDELWALGLLDKIIERDRQDRDALPGSVVKLVKQAAVILRKRQERKEKPKPKFERGPKHTMCVFDETERPQRRYGDGPIC